jgi:hypothetical protein
VQVADERRQDLAQARIFATRNLAQHRFGDVFLVFNDHRAAPPNAERLRPGASAADFT